MLRIIHGDESNPRMFLVNLSAQFEPGQVAQLSVNQSQIVCSVSDGTAPCGIFDDIKSAIITCPVIEELVIAYVNSPATHNGSLVTSIDIKKELNNADLIDKKFSSSVPCIVNYKNGVITFLKDTPLNADINGDGILDSIVAHVNYRYRIPRVLGEDSTAGSGQVAVRHSRMFAETSMYDVTQSYPLNAPLFVNTDGEFTTRKISDRHSSVGAVTAPPNRLSGLLQLIWW